MKHSRLCADIAVAACTSPRPEAPTHGPPCSSIFSMSPQHPGLGEQGSTVADSVEDSQCSVDCHHPTPLSCKSQRCGTAQATGSCQLQQAPPSPVSLLGHPVAPASWHRPQSFAPSTDAIQGRPLELPLPTKIHKWPDRANRKIPKVSAFSAPSP